MLLEIVPGTALKTSGFLLRANQAQIGWFDTYRQAVAAARAIRPAGRRIQWTYESAGVASRWTATV